MSTPTTFAIPGLPDGWEAVRWGRPKLGEWFISLEGPVIIARHNVLLTRMIVRRVESTENPIHPAASCGAAVCRAMEIANEQSAKQPMLTQEMVDRAQAMERAEDEPLCIMCNENPAVNGESCRDCYRCALEAVGAPVSEPLCIMCNENPAVNGESCRDCYRCALEAVGAPVSEPLCTWPLGVFKDGWLAEDENGDVYWYELEPKLGIYNGEWTAEDGACFINHYHPEDCYLPLKITFRPNLPWGKRIVKVGPEAERGMK